jgi:glycosyltransferase involved in cell wall biosynthesis
MMKVIVITTSFPLTSISRSGIFVKKLISHFPDIIKAEVITPDDSETLPNSTFYNYSITRFRYAPKQYQKLAHGPGGILSALKEKKWTYLLLPSFFTAIFVTSLRHARKADLIYANWSINGAIGGIVGAITQKPVVTTLRGTDVNKLKDSRLFRMLIHISITLSAKIITVSQSLKNELLFFFPEFENKIQVIHNGIDDAFFHLERKESKKKVKLVSIGNLIPKKGINLILEALGQLTNWDWTLDIVGDGPDEQALKQSCEEKGLEQRVSFCGAVPPHDIPGILQQADILVFASLREGRPNIVLEAMASGLAIVASNIPSVKELIRDGREGTLFNVGESDDLCRKLEYLFQHPEERKEMGCAARQLILHEDFSWKMAGQRYAKLFKEVTQKE